MKKLYFLIVLCTFSFPVMAQVYVSYAGNVGIGTSSPTSKLEIKKSSNSFTFKPSNAGSLEIGGYDGNTNSTITFWHSQAGFNNLIAKSFTKSSDSTLKTNINRLEDPISVLNQINGYSYFYKENPAERGNKEYGVIAQEIRRVLPEIVDTVKDLLVVDYDQLIPFLIEVVKQQQLTIEQIQNALDALLANDDEYINKSASSSNHYPDSKNSSLKVFQNAPNPFNSTTTIQCYIPQNIQKAQLCIYDVQGHQIKCINLTERGLIQVQLEAGSLSAGIYSYIVVGDGKFSVAKQMVITQ